MYLTIVLSVTLVAAITTIIKNAIWLSDHFRGRKPTVYRIICDLCGRQS